MHDEKRSGISDAVYATQPQRGAREVRTMGEKEKIETEKEKIDTEQREMMAKIGYLTEALKDKQTEIELARLRGMIEGLKYAIRCNGVSGAEVGR